MVSAIGTLARRDSNFDQGTSEQIVNNNSQTPAQTIVQDAEKGLKNQQHQLSDFALQAGGREFESPHVHQF